MSLVSSTSGGPSFFQLWWQEWRRLISWYPRRDPFLVLPAIVWLLVTSQWQEALCLPLLGGYLRMHLEMRKNLRRDT